jgi:hypothetical protein
MNANIKLAAAILLIASAAFADSSAQQSPPATAPVSEQKTPPPADPPTPPAGPYSPELRTFNNAAMVRVDVLMVSVPEAKALSLIPMLRDPTQIGAAEGKLLELVAKKEATLEGWPEVTTHSQCRAVSESVVEQRYPIEFEGPACATCLAKTDVPDAERTKFGTSPAERNRELLLQLGGNIPTTFETRNVGATLEVEPVISKDGTAISLHTSPRVVRFERYAEFPAGTSQKGEKLTIPQPIFTSTQVSTELSIRDGERRLIHVGKATLSGDRIDLFILGAKIIPPPTTNK